MLDARVRHAVALRKEGKSYRDIAEYLLGDRSKKSTIQDWIKRYESQQLLVKGPAILLIDIETAPAIAAAFGRRKVFLTPDHILEEGGQILSYAYNWLHEDTIHSSHLTSEECIRRDDKRLVQEIWKLFETADAVVAHYGNKFDIPMINARLAYHRMQPLPTVKLIDTKLMASKRFRFPANSLDSIAAYLGITRKTDNGGIKRWIDTVFGDPDAMQAMVEYNENDVVVLKQVYLQLARFGHSGSDFNAGLYFEDGKGRCAVCGSEDITETGRSVYTAVSEFPEVRCNNCGAVHRTRATINTLAKRSRLTMQIKVTG